MRRSGIWRKATAGALSAGAAFGAFYVMLFWLLREASVLAPVAASTLLLIAGAILHDGGVKTRGLVIAAGIVAALAGLYVLILWLSLRSWQPEW